MIQITFSQFDYLKKKKTHAYAIVLSAIIFLINHNSHLDINNCPISVLLGNV